MRSDLSKFVPVTHIGGKDRELLLREVESQKTQNQIATNALPCSLARHIDDGEHQQPQQRQCASAILFVITGHTLADAVDGVISCVGSYFRMGVRKDTVK